MKSLKVIAHYVCCRTAVMSCVFMSANSGVLDLDIDRSIELFFFVISHFQVQ